jgi:hypothetical protein
LPQGIVESLNVARFACFFPDGSMSFAWENGSIGCPEIGIGNGTLAVDRRQRFPRFSSCCFITSTNVNTDNLTRLGIEC